MKDERLAEWVRTWQKTGIELEKIRREKIRNEKTSEALVALSDASRAALLRKRLLPTSGLVEMQKWFELLRTANDTNR